MVQKITRLENEATLLDSSGETDVTEYHELGLDISKLGKKIMSEMITPERALLYLVPRRLVKVRDVSTDWGWGVVVNVLRKPSASSILPPEEIGFPLIRVCDRISKWLNEMLTEESLYKHPRSPGVDLGQGTGCVRKFICYGIVHSARNDSFLSSKRTYHASYIEFNLICVYARLIV